MKDSLIPIESKEGVTLYGRIVNPVTKKLGKFEVHSDYLGYDGIVYANYADAEKRMSALIGFHNSKFEKKK